MGIRNKRPRMRREAKSWKSNSTEKEENATRKGRKRREGDRKFTTRMSEIVEAKEANARFIA